MSRKPKPAPAPPPGKPKRPGVLWEPTPQDSRTVKSMCTWATNNEIAQVLGKSHTTLRKHFRAELDAGRLRAQDLVWRSLFNQAIGAPARKADPAKGITAAPAIPPNVNATIKWLEFRAGASARVTVVDGGTEADPATLTDEQIADRLNKLKRSPAVLRAAKAAATVH